MSLAATLLLIYIVHKYCIRQPGALASGSIPYTDFFLRTLFGLTEPDHGSNPGGMITNIKDDGDAYILNGAKMWITNSPIADIAVVWAKNEEGRIKGIIVEKGMKGFSAPEIHGK